MRAVIIGGLALLLTGFTWGDETPPAPSSQLTASAATPTAEPPAPTVRPTRTPGCVRSYGQYFCTGGATAPPNVIPPAPQAVVTDLLEEAVKPAFAPDVFPARIPR